MTETAENFAKRMERKSINRRRYYRQYFRRMPIDKRPSERKIMWSNMAFDIVIDTLKKVASK